MKDQNTYETFDFLNTWKTDKNKNKNYPFVVSQEDVLYVDELPISNIILSPIITPDMPRTQLLKWMPFKKVR